MVTGLKWWYEEWYEEKESNEENAHVGSNIEDKMQELTIFLKVEDLAMNAHIQKSMVICTSLGADVGKWKAVGLKEQDTCLLWLMFTTFLKYTLDSICNWA